MNSVKQCFTLDLTNSIGVRRPLCLKAASPLDMAYPPAKKIHRLESFILGLLEARGLTILVRSNGDKEGFLSLWIFYY
jgi:hypothetical protein